MPVVGADIGNSAIKLGILNSAGAMELQRIAALDPALLSSLDESTFWSVCSVNSPGLLELSAWISRHRPNDSIHVIESDDIPIETNVDDRRKVGRDRLVAAWNAWDTFSEELIVIDAGTAVTIDHVDKNGIFQGGVIFPGAAASLRLLSNSTRDLPNLLDRDFVLEDLLQDVVGKNTETAILRGVYQSQMSAIKTISASISGSARIVATGGEIEFFSKLLPRNWTIDPLLVVQGAWKIGSKILAEK